MILQSIRRLLPFAACSLVMAASVGCAAEARSAGGQGGAEASQVCLDLQDMSRTLTKAKTLTAFSAQSDVKTLRAGVDQGFAALKASAAEENIDVAALQKEVDKFDAFTTRVPPGMTVGQSAAVISGQAAVVAKEQAKIADAAGCTPGS